MLIFSSFHPPPIFLLFLDKKEWAYILSTKIMPGGISYLQASKWRIEVVFDEWMLMVRSKMVLWTSTMSRDYSSRRVGRGHKVHSITSQNQGLELSRFSLDLYSLCINRNIGCVALPWHFKSYILKCKNFWLIFSMN